MGASTSTQYKCTQRNPTRNIRTILTFNEQNHTFCLTQEMEKALAEEQVLKTHMQFTGTIEKINTDIIEENTQRIVKGNPTFKLITTKGKFETRWGDKFFQVKRGTLKLEAPKKFTYYNAINHSHTNHNEINNNNNSITSLDDDTNNTNFSFDIVAKQQNDNRENEVHPWMMTHHQSRRSNSNLHNDNTMPDPKDLYFGGRRRSGSSPGCLNENNPECLQSFYYYKPKPEINILHNGQFMNELLNCRNIETMNNLLKVDLDDWSASFTVGALDMHLTILSEVAHLKYHKPKFEYLWAQLQDESPILMSLCSLSYDDQQHQLYFPLSN